MALDPLTIQSTLRSISGDGRLGAPEIEPIAPGPIQSQPAAEGPSFRETLSEYLSDVNNELIAADQGMADLASGRSQDVHGTLIAMQKADIQLRLLVEVRNKVIGAYEEVMRIQA